MSALAAMPTGSMSASVQQQTSINGSVTRRRGSFVDALLLNGSGTFMSSPVKVTGFIHGPSLFNRFSTGRLRLWTDTGVSPVKLIAKTITPFPHSGLYTFTIPRGEFRGVSGTVDFNTQISPTAHGPRRHFQLTSS